jgi:hypothetical protein
MLIVKDVPRLYRIGGILDVWEDHVGTSHVDDGLGSVSSFLLVSPVGTVLPGVAFYIRLFSPHGVIGHG